MVFKTIAFVHSAIAPGGPTLSEGEHRTGTAGGIPCDGP